MDNWFFYDWNMQGDPARFGVDMSFAHKWVELGLPILMHVRCEMQSQEKLTPKAARHINRMEKKLLKNVDGEYVGFVEDDFRRVFFFYVKSPKKAELAEELIEKEKYLYCEVGCAQDESWDTYNTLLYPDAARLFTESNRKNIELYRKKGDCLYKTRRVVYHTFFPAEVLCQQFAQEIRLAGFAIGDPEFNPDLEEAYGITVFRLGTLEKQDLDKNTSDIIYTAEKYFGKLLYWNCPVVPKNGPMR